MSTRSSVDKAPARCSGGHSGSFPVGDLDFSLSHARAMLINSPFTFHYRAQNSPSLFTYHHFACYLRSPKHNELSGLLSAQFLKVSSFLNICSLTVLYHSFHHSAVLSTNPQKAAATTKADKLGRLQGNCRKKIWLVFSFNLFIKLRNKVGKNVIVKVLEIPKKIKF